MPASPTPSNTGSLRSFQRDTERAQRFCDTEKSYNEEARTSAYQQSKNQSTTSNGEGNAPLKGCIGLLLILNSMHNSASDRRWARFHSKTLPARKPALLTTLSISLRCESAAEHYTAEQYSKTGRTKLQKDLRRIDRSWNTCQDFLTISSLWAAALETERRCFSKVTLASKVTPNINRFLFDTKTKRFTVGGKTW